MSVVTPLNFQLVRIEEVDEVEKSGIVWIVDSSSEVISEEEKDYQRLVKEKLKSVADWDSQHSKQFSLG